MLPALIHEQNTDSVISHLNYTIIINFVDNTSEKLGNIQFLRGVIHRQNAYWLNALNWHNSRQYAIIELVKREVPLWQLSTQKNNLIQ
mgnify:FL=1